jgi:hypothetical protein
MMKAQKTQDVDARKPHPAAHRGTAAPQQEPARHARPSFDDLHARITTRAYELYVQRVCQEGRAEEDWLEVEREIVSREFPVLSSSRREDCL